MASFGSTFCAISHLEIKDGDNCMLFPLGFKLEYNHKTGDDILNYLSYNHYFESESIEVMFNGNSCEFITKQQFREIGDEYGETGYGESEMYMLVHLEFYKGILKNVSTERFENLNILPLFNTINKIWEEAMELKEKTHFGYMIEHTKGLKTFDEITQLEHYSPNTPQWIIDLYKVAWFMGQMGIPPHPNFAIDQKDFGQLYEEIRQSAVRKTNANVEINDNTILTFDENSGELIKKKNNGI